MLGTRELVPSTGVNKSRQLRSTTLSACDVIKCPNTGSSADFFRIVIRVYAKIIGQWYAKKCRSIKKHKIYFYYSFETYENKQNTI